ncbi:PREDICTED: uncharacterized protein LOC107164577 [Diuraphis noxia]|uniref:uncharacterized protein LOC107164577 n=1 Tax=Diuraphis noxia TaxID=143948 RepID=UPI000763A41B|nr:PREDICTED: uncharacterized protein LOC107164577 [Diuraphis noxia]
MKTDSKMVLIFLSFLAVARCTDLQPLVSSDEENRVSPIDGPAAGVGDGDLRLETSAAESTTAAAAVDGHRSGRQFYQQPAAFAYQSYPQRRAYNKIPGQPMKRPKFRTKPGGGRRGPRPRRRPSMSGGPPTMSSMTGSRYRRLPSPAPMMRPQHNNYIDAAGGVDYDDGFESAPLPVSSFDYGDMREFDHESAAYAYGPPLPAVTGGRSRKRPVVLAAAPTVGYADEQRPTAIVHVPVRVMRPTAPTPSPAVNEVDVVADPMDKLRQLVHEAMDEHFANRHQELYGDGFGKQQQQHQSNMQQVYSAKYKRQPPASADKEKALHHGHQQQRTADAVRSATTSVQPPLSPSVKVTKDVDVDADGSDDRLTLAEISAYMGAKPAETVLSAGGHRYVLSDALQQSYRQQQRQQVDHHQQLYGGEDHHQPQYLRYVSPFEALYELPAARWTYK